MSGQAGITYLRRSLIIFVAGLARSELRQLPLSTPVIGGVNNGSAVTAISCSLVDLHVLFNCCCCCFCCCFCSFDCFHFSYKCQSQGRF